VGDVARPRGGAVYNKLNSVYPKLGKRMVSTLGACGVTSKFQNFKICFQIQLVPLQRGRGSDKLHAQPPEGAPRGAAGTQRLPRGDELHRGTQQPRQAPRGEARREGRRGGGGRGTGRRRRGSARDQILMDFAKGFQHQTFVLFVLVYTSLGARLYRRVGCVGCFGGCCCVFICHHRRRRLPFVLHLFSFGVLLVIYHRHRPFNHHHQHLPSSI
jgi:hypothetical protein